jgi:hypothetical protein
MNPLKTSEIARRLAARDGVEPPEGLLDKIKSEIPAVLPAAPRIEPGVVERMERRPRRRVWLMAASVAAALGGGVIGLRVMQNEHATPSLAKQESVQKKAGTPRAQAAPRRFQAPAQDQAPKKEEEKLRALGYLSQPQTAPAPEPPPPPPLLAAKPASPAPAMPLEVERGVEGGVEGGVPGGVVGGVPGGAVGRNEAEQQTRQRDESSDLRRDEPAQKTAAAAPSPSTGGTAEPDDQATSSYTLARHSLLDEGRLPPPEAVRTEDFVSFFSDGDEAPVRGDSPGFRLTTLAAELAEVLRGSSSARNVDLDDLLARARHTAAEMADTKRAADVKDLVRMVEATARLKKR